MRKLSLALFVVFILIIIAPKLWAQGRCCIDDGACVGCDSACSTSESFCKAQGGSIEGDPGQSCVAGTSGAECRFFLGGRGCCVIAQGNCVDGEILASCFVDGSGELLIIGESCSELSQCQAPIPTLSEWGLIAMAGVLGIVGFMIIRRRKVTA